VLTYFSVEVLIDNSANSTSDSSGVIVASSTIVPTSVSAPVMPLELPVVLASSAVVDSTTDVISPTSIAFTSDNSFSSFETYPSSSFVLPLSSLAVGPSPVGIPASVASNGEFPVNQSPFSSVADVSSLADNFVATYGPPSDFLNDLPVSAPAKSPLEPKPRGIKEC
jgi:hypothetical protein